ncbi:MAG: hypothetical protein OXN21_14205 [Chloroflexota bacterium]|nr:hypothetical protein [Chloroflexota bacterium]
MRRPNGSKTTRVRMSPAKSTVSCTAEQRDRRQRGLRILARIIARAHLRRQVSWAAQEPPPPGPGAGG